MRINIPAALTTAVAFILTALLSSHCTPKLRPELLENIRLGTAHAGITAPVHVPLIGDRRIPIVDVMINGRGPYRFLIDAGGNVVSLRQSVAAEAGVEVKQRLSKRSALFVRSLEMGGHTFRDVHAVGEPVLDVDGVIGFNVFRDGLLTLDYVHRRLTWEPGELPPPNGRDIIAYELRERTPHIKVDVGGTAIWMNVDTGAEAPLIFPASAMKTVRLASPPVPGRDIWNQAVGTEKTTEAVLDATLTFGERSIEKPRVVFKHSLEDYLIGSGLFADSILTFDTMNRRVRITRVSPKS